MPDPRALPLVRWGEHLRRERQTCRSRRLRAAATLAAALAGAGVGATLISPPRAALLWNASASTQPGLYRVTGGEARVGDMVVAWAPATVRQLAAERSYLPTGVPLVKPVAAAAGDRVCAAGDALLVNGAPVAFRRREDPSGRHLPRWTGCRRLAPGELLLLGEAEASFDGRYFGVTRRRDVIGKARLLWAR